MPKVSVIIPAYNYGAYILEALKSLQQQSLSDWECWIIDDGSTDATYDIVKEISKQDARIQYHYQRNQGQPSARNAGLRRASGDCIQFLDADDLLESKKLQVQSDFLQENSGIDVVYGEVRYFKSREPNKLFLNRWDAQNAEWMPKISGRGEELVSALIEKNILELGSAMFRKKSLQRVGLFNPALQGVEDYDYCLRSAIKGLSFVHNSQPQTLILMREHAGSFSKSKFQMYKKEIMMRRKMNLELKRKCNREIRQLNKEKMNWRLNKLQDFLIEQARSGNTQYLSMKELKWLLTNTPIVKNITLAPRIAKALVSHAFHTK